MGAAFAPPINRQIIIGCSELHARAKAKDGNRSTVPVVSRVVDELIVDRQMGEAEYGDAVVHFQDLLGTRIRQLAVADNPTQTAGGEIQLALVRDPVGPVVKGYQMPARHLA